MKNIKVIIAAFVLAAALAGGIYFFYLSSPEKKQGKVAKRVRIELPLEEKKAPQETPQTKTEPAHDVQKTPKEPPHTKIEPKEKDLHTSNQEIKKIEKESPPPKKEEAKKIEKKEEKPEVKLHAKILAAKEEGKTSSKKIEKTKEAKKGIVEQKGQQKKEPEKDVKGSWVLHIASFAVLDDTKSIVKKLKEDGYNAYTAQFSLNGKRWYRLRVGFFQSEETAKAEAKKIGKAYNIKGIWITRPTKKEILLNSK